MPKFSTKSLERLRGVHPDLIAVMQEAIRYTDFTITEGLRTKERQKELYDGGFSKTLDSKHLTGEALDIAPWPVDYKNLEAFHFLAGVVTAVATRLYNEGTITRKLKWGGHWKSFKDMPHWELE